MPPSHRAEERRDNGVLDADLLRRWPLPVDADGDKFSRGTVVVIAGSPTTPGAAVLAGMAALRMGAGRLQIATASSISALVAVTVPEAMVLPLSTGDTGALCASRDLDELIRSADTILVGPGLSSDPTPVRLVESVLRQASDAAVVVLDAAALRALHTVEPALLRQSAGRLVLTPNRQEARMLLEGSGDASPPDLNERDLLANVAHGSGAVVTSFGSIRVWDGRGWDAVSGHPSLGTSGSGDVLAGMVAGLAGRTGDPVQATCWATYAHAATGEHLGRRCGYLGFLARELIDAVGAVMGTTVGPIVSVQCR
jgi:hydroxyethylthiazole kinase-like uncharacterized protein yjeF